MSTQLGQKLCARTPLPTTANTTLSTKPLLIFWKFLRRGLPIPPPYKFVTHLARSADMTTIAATEIRFVRRARVRDKPKINDWMDDLVVGRVYYSNKPYPRHVRRPTRSKTE